MHSSYVNYSKKNTEKSANELETLVRTAIQKYSDDNLEGFDKTLRSSKVSGIIDDLDVGILSSEMSICPVIEYSPPLNFNTNPTFRFETLLIKPYPYRAASGFTKEI